MKLVIISLVVALVACGAPQKGPTVSPSNVASLDAAVRQGDAASVRRLVASDPSLKRARAANGVPYTLSAMFAGQREIADVLASDRDDLDVLEAAAFDRLPRVRAILASDPSQAKVFGADGFTALHYAAHLGYADITAALLEAGADPGAVARNDLSATPLHSAVAGGNLETVRLLVEHGAPIDATYEQGMTALHVAASDGNVAIVDLLLAHGASRDAKNAAGERPIDLARRAGKQDVVERLSRGLER